MKAGVIILLLSELLKLLLGDPGACSLKSVFIFHDSYRLKSSVFDPKTLVVNGKLSTDFLRVKTSHTIRKSYSHNRTLF